MDVVLDQDGLPDPSAMVKRAIAADLDSAILKEREFPVAPNSLTWCTSHKYLNVSDPLWPRQIQMLVRFFEDVCYFCSDVDYVYNVPVDDSVGNVLDRFCLLEHGVCPRCKRNRLEMLRSWQQDPRYSKYHTWDPSVNLRGVPPNEFNGIWGQRSGKSFAVATFFWPYILHRYLALPNATSYYKLASNSVLEAAFVAPTKKQISTYMWTPFLHVFDGSPWFREYVQHLKNEEAHLGVTMYHRQIESLIFPSKRLHVFMKAANSGNLRGGTRFFAAVDEWGWFNCLDGESLVNTNEGLLPIKSNLTGKQVCVGGQLHRIKRHAQTGEKIVHKTTLKDGYSLTSTAEHKVRVLTPALDVVWRLVGDLTVGDHVAVGLGGEFPDELRLDYIPEEYVPKQVAAMRLMQQLGTFRFEDITRQVDTKGLHVVTQRLFRRGWLEKRREGKYSVFTITDEFDLAQIEQEYRNRPRGRKYAEDCIFPSKMTVELGYLLGYFVSKGSYAKGAPKFAFTNTDETVVQHFVHCFSSVFGFAPHVVRHVPKPQHKVAYHVYVAYAVIKKFLRYIGMSPSIAPTKTIPWSILQAPRDVVLAFMSAYIEGDGTITKDVVSMATTSPLLAKQLQLLFLRLGVVCALKHLPKYQDNHSDQYSVRLRRYDSVILMPQLSCATKGKLFRHALGSRREDAYKIPFTPSYIDKSKQGTSNSAKKYAYVLGELNTNSSNCFALRRLKDEDPALYSKATKMVDTGSVWLPVESIEELEVRPVYDIAVDSADHAFVADGVVVHNSTEDGKKRAGVTDGAEVFTSLNRSIRTIKTAANRRRRQLNDYNVVDSYIFCISSPSSINDPIEQRAAIASKSPRMMHTRFPTWEVNPNEDEETLFEEEGADLAKYKRDFCAQPPRAASPFIAQSPLLKQLVDVDQTTRHLFTYEIVAAEDRETGVTLLRPTIKRRAADKSTPRVLTIDNGEKSNSFAVTMASYYPEHDGTLLEEFLEVAPYQNHQVDLQWCYDELILGLVKTFNVQQVLYDQWESSYAIRDLRTNYGIDAERYSLKWKDFSNFREDLLGSKIWFPVPECEPDELLLTNNLVERARTPRAHFQLQLTTVNQFGKQVVKPDQGNDDLFRCAVLAHWAIQNHKDKYRGRGVRRRGGQRRQVAFGRSAGQGRVGGGQGGFRSPARGRRR